jgi:hypothetical protein
MQVRFACIAAVAHLPEILPCLHPFAEAGADFALQMR